VRVIRTRREGNRGGVGVGVRVVEVGAWAARKAVRGDQGTLR
jgi:hypothetical protein